MVIPLATGIQPISEGWIGLDAEVRRADIPIRQVLFIISHFRRNVKTVSPFVRVQHTPEKRRARGSLLSGGCRETVKRIHQPPNAFRLGTFFKVCAMLGLETETGMCQERRHVLRMGWV